NPRPDDRCAATARRRRRQDRRFVVARRGRPPCRKPDRAGRPPRSPRRLAAGAAVVGGGGADRDRPRAVERAVAYLRGRTRRRGVLHGRRVLLIIAGGIAAYKSLELIRRLRDRGAAVRVVMTRAAAQFVTPLAVASLSED